MLLWVGKISKMNEKNIMTLIPSSKINRKRLNIIKTTYDMKTTNEVLTLLLNTFDKIKLEESK